MILKDVVQLTIYKSHIFILINGKSIKWYTLQNDNFKYSMYKMDNTKQMVKLTQCVGLIELINDKRI